MHGAHHVQSLWSTQPSKTAYQIEEDRALVEIQKKTCPDPPQSQNRVFTSRSRQIHTPADSRGVGSNVSTLYK